MATLPQLRLAVVRHQHRFYQNSQRMFVAVCLAAADHDGSLFAATAASAGVGSKMMVGVLRMAVEVFVVVEKNVVAAVVVLGVVG